MPKLLGAHGDPHTWRLHSYKGVGRIPVGMGKNGDPSERILLDQLPRLLRGYKNTHGVDAVVVILDTDNRNCVNFLAELKIVAKDCNFSDKTLFRLAIEEVEAWYFGDREALVAAYPKAKPQPLEKYTQDAICGTWELLADVVHPGGSASIKNAGWPTAGQMKHEWAEKIGPRMAPLRNISPSFAKLREGLLRLVSGEGNLGIGHKIQQPS